MSQNKVPSLPERERCNWSSSLKFLFVVSVFPNIVQPILVPVHQNKVKFVSCAECPLQLLEYTVCSSLSVETGAVEQAQSRISLADAAKVSLQSGARCQPVAFCIWCLLLVPASVFLTKIKRALIDTRSPRRVGLVATPSSASSASNHTQP